MSDTLTAVRRLLVDKIHPDMEDIFEKWFDRLEELLEFSDGMKNGYVVRHGDVLRMTPRGKKMIEEFGQR